MTNENTDYDIIDDIVDTIIKLPIKNLEDRIRSIELNIRERQKIFENSTSVLSEREIELESHLWRMRYCLGNEFTRKLGLENELARIKNMQINDILIHFNDQMKLMEKLQLAREELAMEKEKKKLIN